MLSTLLRASPLLLGLSPLGLQASPAPLEEIVVTGTLAPRTLEELPTAVTVFTQADLEARGQSHLEGLLAESPNVNAANGGGRARFFQMRGIGERGQFSEPLNPSVGLILDGVDLSGAGGAAQLFDIETINLFRGPQPGRYGANALAGLMVLESVAPPAPGDPSTGTLTAEGGNLGTYGLAGAFGTRFSDRLGVRVAAFDRQSDGWMRNQTLGKNDTGNYDERGARVRLAYALAPAWDLDLSLSRLELDNGYDGFTFDNSRRSLADAPGQDALDSTLGSLRLTRADLPGGLRATLLIAGSEGHIDYGYDEDWTFEGFHPDGYSSEDRYRRDRQTTTAELRLQQLEGSRPWTLGLYQHQRTVDLLRDYTFAPGPFTSQFETERRALYGELGQALAGPWRFEGGLRLEQRRDRYDDNAAVRFRPQETLLGGRAALLFDGSDGWTAYLALSRGYKAGGFNTDGSLPDDLRDFRSEGLWNGELGLRARSPEGTLAGALTLFWMQREDQQISTSIVRLREDGSAEFIDFTGNAAKGRNYGLEAEGRWQATDGLSLQGTLGLLATRFDRYENGAGDALTGRDQAHAPRYQFSLQVRQALPGNGTLELTALGRDGFYWSDSHDARARSLYRLNAQLALPLGPATLALYGRNLTDERYGTRGFGGFGNDPRNGYAVGEYLQLGAPREVGARLTLSW